MNAHRLVVNETKLNGMKSSQREQQSDERDNKARVHSSKQLRNELPLHVRQPAFDAVVLEAEALVVEA